METLTIFFFVSLASTAMPGPAVFYVSSQGVASGLRYALSAGLGIITADACYILLSVTGLTAILLTSYELFSIVKWVGAAYLVYLGVLLIRASCCSLATASPITTRTISPRKAFVGGFVLHAANPKALLYFGSLVPQFVKPSQPLAAQLVALAAIHLATASLVLLAYGALSARLRRVSASPRWRRVFHATTGSFFVGAGVSLAFIRRGTE